MTVIVQVTLYFVMKNIRIIFFEMANIVLYRYILKYLCDKDIESINLLETVFIVKFG